MASSSTKDLMQEYHRLAADTLLGGEYNKVVLAILDAAENGQLERLQKLLSEHESLVDSHHPDTGDTPLISSARNGHTEVVDYLLRIGADTTLENDSRESFLNVVGESLQRHILKSINHEDRSMTNAKALLQAAWLGDAVTVRKCLSGGSHYLDVNFSNRDGLTPLLLVTKDVSLFSRVENAMQTTYNPEDVLKQLLDHHVDVNQTDRHGCSPLHLIASSGPNIHATKMVSLLLQNGANTDVQSPPSLSPLHTASSDGHLTVIVALVEEGGADINMQTSDSGDTPLILTVRGGHNEAACYLLNKGADVTVVTESGDSALSVARSPRMRRMIQEAWTEQSEESKERLTSDDDEEEEAPIVTSQSPGQPDVQSASTSYTSINEDDEQGLVVTSPLSPLQPSFFLTDRQISRSLDFEETELINDVKESLHHPLQRQSHDQREGSHDLSPDSGNDVAVSEGEGSCVRDEVKKHKFKRKVKSESLLTAGGARGGDPVSTQSVEDVRPTAQTLTAPQEDTRTAGVVAGKRGRERGRETGRKMRSMKGKGSTLTTQRSIDISGKKMSHESHVTNRGSHVTRSSLPGKEHMQLFPKTFTFSSTPKPPASFTDNRLPKINLTNMNAVAMISVDTKQGNVRVHGFGEGHSGSGTPLQIQRSRSLITATSGRAVSRLEKKRNSTGSMTPFPPVDTKGVLLPRIVTPQLFGCPPPPSLQQSPRHSTHHQSPRHSAHHQSPRHSALPQPAQYDCHSLQPKTEPQSHTQSTLRPALSVVNEESESLASSVSLVAPPSDHALLSRLPSSGESTLKASSQSDFEPDNLNQATPLQTTPPQTTPPHTLALRLQEPSTVRSTLSLQHSALPDTLDQFCQLTKQLSIASHAHSHTHHSSHTVINYAVQDGSTPLSPIWNQTHSSQHSDVSEGYVMSRGDTPSTEATDVPVPDSRVPVAAGLDSGQGESTDEERGGGSGASSSSETEPLDTHCLQWKKGRLLGKGAFGKVWEGLLDSAKMIAVKEIELDITTAQRAQSQYDKLRLEVEILRSIHHRNVVRYLGTTMDDCRVFIFMEYISGGSLQSIIKRFGSLTDKTTSHYTRQIVQALNYLHSNGIVHRDVKGANVMVTSSGVIKLIDFGSAKQSCQEVSGELRSVRGTPYWMAPEVIRGEGYGRKSDVWSLGCTVHEMALSKAPWAEYVTPEAAIFQIGSGKPIPPLPEHLSQDITRFIHRCVVKDPRTRPGADELLNDPFLKKYKKKKKK